MWLKCSLSHGWWFPACLAGHNNSETCHSGAVIVWSLCTRYRGGYGRLHVTVTTYSPNLSVKIYLKKYTNSSVRNTQKIFQWISTLYRTKQKRKLSSLEQSHKELAVTVNVLLSEVAKVKKDTLKKWVYLVNYLLNHHS